jgi:hypothetical protein
MQTAAASRVQGVGAALYLLETRVRGHPAVGLVVSFKAFKVAQVKEACVQVSITLIVHQPY